MQSLKHILHLCLISGLLFLVSCAQEPQIPGKIVSFEDVFQLKNKIYLDENIKLKGIHTLNVDANGRILIVDFLSEQVILVDKEGNLIKEITPDSCNLGHNWKPFIANFNKNGSILVLTKFGEIYWFSNIGECIIKGSTLRKQPNMDLAFDNSGNFYFKEQSPIETYIHKSDSLGIKTSRFKIENSLPIWNGFSMRAPIETNGEDIWIGLTYFDGFYIYSQEGIKLHTIQFDSPLFTTPKQDLNERSTKKLMEDSKSYSSIIDLFKIKNGVITLIFHRFNLPHKSEKQLGISIYNKHQNNLRYVLTDERGWFTGKDSNDLFYHIFVPSKEDIAQCKQCGIKTTMGLNVYQLKNN